MNKAIKIRAEIKDIDKQENNMINKWADSLIRKKTEDTNDRNQEWNNEITDVANTKRIVQEYYEQLCV